MKVLVCDPIHEDSITKLRQAGFEVDVKSSISYEELRKVVSEYDVLIVRSRTKINKEIFELGKRLKAICRAGVGLDNIDLETAEKRGVEVLNSPEAPSQAVAELTIGLIISLARKIPFADFMMKEGKWLKAKLMGWQLENRILGTVGLGNIGEKVAKMAKSIGMRILVTKRTPPDPRLLAELEGEYISLDELLRRSDIVTLHVPLTSQTRNMIDQRELDLMKDGAFIINTSRGAVINEKALLKALQNGKLGGAAIDVYEIEPPQNLELIRLSNVVCTPHIGSQTLESQRNVSMIVVEKLIRLLK